MRRHSRARSQIKLAAVLVLAFLLILLLPPPPFTPFLHRRASYLHYRSEEDRAASLLSALPSWTSGPPPLNVLLAAAGCTPRDAADALLRHLSQILPESGVIDVGANKGYPVTSLALKSNPKWVVSIEPDQRNFGVLSRIKPSHSTIFQPTLGAISETPGKMDMAFHKTRDDFTCFNCLNTSRDEVTVQSVDVHTLDSLVSQFSDKVALLKTDTQGHEASVLSSAPRLLQSGRVQAVLMEFDPTLLLKYENAETAVSIITQAGLRCISLVFAGLNRAEQFPFYGEEVTASSLPKFWTYVTELNKYTDLLCLRK